MTIQTNELKHFPEFLLKEVVRLKECDAEEASIVAKKGDPLDWEWFNENSHANICNEDGVSVVDYKGV